MDQAALPLNRSVAARGKQIRLSGRKVILAAGAVHTPAILLRSNGAGGLANGSGQVGRNLMRHFVDYYIVYTKTRYTSGPQKQIAMNDFYSIDGMKLGTIQSNGRMPPARSIAAGFKETLQDVWRPVGHLYPVIRAVVEFRVRRMWSSAHALESFLEDLPYQSNRIGLSEDKQNITLEYSIGPFEARRLAQFRLHIANALKPLKFKKIYRASENRVLGHVCGTCRFGIDPQTSVLNRDNRALYVVDASFFPTSGGINPSLTIAANALRVADRIVARSMMAPHPVSPATHQTLWLGSIRNPHGSDQEGNCFDHQRNREVHVCHIGRMARQTP